MSPRSERQGGRSPRLSEDVSVRSGVDRAELLTARATAVAVSRESTRRNRRKMTCVGTRPSTTSTPSNRGFRWSVTVRMTSNYRPSPRCRPMASTPHWSAGRSKWRPPPHEPRRPVPTRGRLRGPKLVDPVPLRGARDCVVVHPRGLVTRGRPWLTSACQMCSHVSAVGLEYLASSRLTPMPYERCDPSPAARLLAAIAGAHPPDFHAWHAA